MRGPSSIAVVSGSNIFRTLHTKNFQQARRRGRREPSQGSVGLCGRPGLRHRNYQVGQCPFCHVLGWRDNALLCRGSPIRHSGSRRGRGRFHGASLGGCECELSGRQEARAFRRPQGGVGLANERDISSIYGRVPYASPQISTYLAY